MYNVGISMRVTNAQTYHELRDSISQDWPRYLNYLFPESSYFFIPNIGTDAIDYCRNHDLNVLILTGGEDIGTYESRDTTELALLEFMIRNKLPVIGICRGMQLIHHYFGGKLIKGNNSFIKEHRATEHEIVINNDIVTVNSYHNLKIDESTLNSSLSVHARNVADKSIESFLGSKILGLMWHPERDMNFSAFTKQIILNFLSDNV